MARSTFQAGVPIILDVDPVPVILTALEGMRHSLFSWSPAKGLLKRVWSKVTLNISEAHASVAMPGMLLEQLVLLRVDRR